MSFIDHTYLRGSVDLPNLEYGGITTNIDQAISEAEDEILIKLLGSELHSLLIADLDESGNPQSERFINLVDGASFTNEHNSITQTLIWKGLKNTEKISLLAYYTFYIYAERNATSMSDVGNTLPEAANAVRVNPIDKMVDAWNKMLKLYGKIPELYNGHISEQVYGSELNVLNSNPSAYNFLLANIDVYPEWIFTPLFTINRFQI